MDVQQDGSGAHDLRAGLPPGVGKLTEVAATGQPPDREWLIRVTIASHCAFSEAG
jgi:hypothetical protein